MALPRAVNGTVYRTEAIDLAPGGSTIAVTVPSDNPYELCGEPTVHTQMSGGMTSPDPRMRSKQVSYKQAQHVNQGFIPGMGDGEEMEIGAYGPVKKHPVLRHPVKRVKEYTVTATRVAHPRRPQRRMGGFMPGMGNLGDDQPSAFTTFLRDATSAATGVITASGQADAQKKLANAQQKLADAQITGNQAAIIQAQAALAAAQRPEAPKPQGMSTGAKIGIGLGGLAAIGLVIYLLARK
jgi:hypothetical protein